MGRPDPIRRLVGTARADRGCRRAPVFQIERSPNRHPSRRERIEHQVYRFDRARIGVSRGAWGPALQWCRPAGRSGSMVATHHCSGRPPLIGGLWTVPGCGQPGACPQPLDNRPGGGCPHCPQARRIGRRTRRYLLIDSGILKKSTQTPTEALTDVGPIGAVSSRLRRGECTFGTASRHRELAGWPQTQPSDRARLNADS